MTVSKYLWWTLISLKMLLILAADNYRVDTPGCQIRNYKVSYKDADWSKDHSCGKRQIYISKTSEGNKIIFKMIKKFESCCYTFIYRHEYNKQKTSQCYPFQNNTEVTLSNDFIQVTCLQPKYKDVYALVKPIDYKKSKTKRNPTWNVLLLGLDTMSRGRAYNSLPKTVKLLNQYGWFDFQGYHKIAPHTISNVIAVLTGRNQQWPTSSTKCRPDMSACNDMIIWHKFQQAAYVTAFAEDGIHSPGSLDWYHGFSVPPTNHYMKPFFLAGERRHKTLVCSGQISSGRQILKYILDYARTYRNEKFFGFFWISTIGHDLGQSPKRFDKTLMRFYKKLITSGILANTIVILLGDHGIQFGPDRYSIESYYEDSLPMLFMWLPQRFHQMHKQSVTNLAINQRRLVTPYDLYLTLCDILKKSQNLNFKPIATGCRHCTSLFNEVPKTRTCSDVAIAYNWCTCYSMKNVSLKDHGGRCSLIQAENHLYNMYINYPTKPCTSCHNVYMKTLLRIHSYLDPIEQNIIYIIALLTSPNDVTYEITVRKYLENNIYQYEVYSVERLTEFVGKDFCSVQILSHVRCECKREKDCKVNRSKEINN